jgi:hypothetical protein
MSHRRSTIRSMMRESLLGLLVLALLGLNFGHVSVGFGGELRIVPDAWCGDPLLPDSPAPSPCHACRLGSGALLPPVPPVPVPPLRIAIAILHGEPAAPIVTPLAFPAAQPRAPPRA